MKTPTPKRLAQFLIFEGILLLLLAATLPKALSANRAPASFAEKKFSINLQDSDLRDVLRLIAEQGKVRVEMDNSVHGNVSYSFTDTSLEDALRTIAKDNDLVYYFENGVVYIEKGSLGSSRRGGHRGVYSIGINHSNARSIFEKLPKIFAPGESLLVDETSNSLIFYGSESSRRKLMQFVEVFDKSPTQILIEAIIVSTSKKFMRDIGFRWGDTGDLSLNRTTSSTWKFSTAPQSNPNATGKVLLGFVDTRTLEAQIFASETSGDAKVISHPKVVTLNNKPATIHSGVTFHVKTLSGASTANSGGSLDPVTGGLQSISAGMQLKVLPSVVGTDRVKLDIDVSNSEPDNALSVDNIPGIIDNSANTTVIVKDGSTAALAGLVKSSLSKSQDSVPLLSRIPILGWLFRSHSDRNFKDELVIFITPRIVGTESALIPTAPPDSESTQSASTPEAAGVPPEAVSTPEAASMSPKNSP